MREILFRGKRIDNGEWVYGSVVNFRSIYNEIYTVIIPKVDNENSMMEFKSVDPSTVGQYTGLKDKNGKRIFESDIIKSDNGKLSSISVVKFGEYYPKMFYYMMDIHFPNTHHLNANGFLLNQPNMKI